MTDERDSQSTDSQRPHTVAQDESATEGPPGPTDEARSSEENDAQLSGEDVSAAKDSPDPEELRKEISALQDRLLRGQAELENFRRRSLREVDEIRKYQSLPVLRDLLPVVDNLERAVKSAEQMDDVTSLLEGIRMVAQQLGDTLKAHSVKVVSPGGESFDPNLHEALSQVPSDEFPPMTVIEVVETGYRLHDRVVRPARVIVSCAPAAPPPSEPEGE